MNSTQGGSDGEEEHPTTVKHHMRIKKRVVDNRQKRHGIRSNESGFHPDSPHLLL
jgi:hypothetical protein